MPKPPIDKQPVLPKEVALEVADLARVRTEEEREQFCDLVCGTVQIVWEWDRRALSSTPGQALLDAAEAALILHQQLGNLNENDRAWVERLLVQTVPDKDMREWIEKEFTGRRVDLPWYGGGLRGLQLSV
jgi:hypothetical protein